MSVKVLHSAWEEGSLSHHDGDVPVDLHEGRLELLLPPEGSEGTKPLVRLLLPVPSIWLGLGVTFLVSYNGFHLFEYSLLAFGFALTVVSDRRRNTVPESIEKSFIVTHFQTKQTTDLSILSLLSSKTFSEN